MALFRGVSEIMLAFALRRLLPAGTSPSPSPVPASGDPAVADVGRSDDVVA